ncbi:MULTISPECIES: sensor histidine kinase [unclassified Actinotalea]|uniref:sensor histidine kinase n=1 Tax=unclassified Actinotalea TaxID=2638618 RepID=UPI0015F434B2|nr:MULTISPECIES: histidine kinase [unclassified Actinotalea]
MTAPPPEPAAAPLFTEQSARRLGPVRRFFAQHPVVVDVLLILWFLVFALFVPLVSADTMRYDSVAENDPLADRMWWWVLGLALAGSVVLTRRRARPLAVTAAMTALGVVSLATTGQIGGFDLGVAFGVYVVAASYRPSVTWRTVGLCTAVLAAAALAPAARAYAYFADGWAPPPGSASTVRDPVALSEWFAMLLLLAICVLLAVSFGTGVRNRRLHLADLVERANALARERDQQLRLARVAERSTIAREMHDVVAHSLSVMIALGDGANAALDRSPDRSLAALRELSATGRSALGDIRRIFGVLGAQEGSPGGGAPAAGPAPYEPQPEGLDLAALVERFRAAGLPVRATGLTDPALERADARLRLAAHRIAQEALTNALRYAPGTAAVELAVRRGPGVLEIEVVDRGPAAPVRTGQGSGRGIIGMRERAAVNGGALEAGPYAGGWRVRASLPWPDDASDRTPAPASA